MKPPISVHPLTEDECEAVKAGLRSSDAFTLRRSQIILASARGDRPSAIARSLGCASQTVRNAIHAFNARALDALAEGSHANHSSRASFDARAVERLQALTHRSPRDCGYPTGIWTLDLLADEAHRQGITATRVSDETIRQAIKQLDVSWKRAKRWITSPDPAYTGKKQ